MLNSTANNDKVKNIYHEMDKNCEQMLEQASSLPDSVDKQRILLSLHKQKAVIAKTLNQNV